MVDPTAHFTPAQEALYVLVINDYSGRELRKVIAAADATDADKQAVTDVLYPQPTGR